MPQPLNPILLEIARTEICHTQRGIVLRDRGNVVVRTGPRSLVRQQLYRAPCTTCPGKCSSRLIELTTLAPAYVSLPCFITGHSTVTVTMALSTPGIRNLTGRCENRHTRPELYNSR